MHFVYLNDKKKFELINFVLLTDKTTLSHIFLHSCQEVEEEEQRKKENKQTIKCVHYVDALILNTLVLNLSNCHVFARLTLTLNF